MSDEFGLKVELDCKRVTGDGNKEEIRVNRTSASGNEINK